MVRRTVGLVPDLCLVPIVELFRMEHLVWETLSPVKFNIIL